MAEGGRSDGRSLLSLVCLHCLPLSSPLGCLWPGFSVQDIIPPSEAASIVPNEPLVVDIVVVSTCPEGQEVVQTPGKFVPAVSIDGLKQAEDDPHVHGQDVEISCDGTI